MLKPGFVFPDGNLRKAAGGVLGEPCKPSSPNIGSGTKLMEASFYEGLKALKHGFVSPNLKHNFAMIYLTLPLFLATLTFLANAPTPDLAKNHFEYSLSANCVNCWSTLSYREIKTLAGSFKYGGIRRSSYGKLCSWTYKRKGGPSGPSELSIK